MQSKYYSGAANCGNNLRAARIQLNMTVEQAAELLHTSKATISRWERQPLNKLPLDVIVSYSQALATPLLSLLTSDESDFGINQLDETTFLEYVKSTEDTKRNAILQITQRFTKLNAYGHEKVRAYAKDLLDASSHTLIRNK